MTGLSQHLDPEDVLLGLHVDDKEQLLEAIARHLHATRGLSTALVLHALRRREAAGSTAVGHGVAIPHARVAELHEIRALYLRLDPPLDLAAPDHRPVSDVVCLMVPAPAAQEHLDILANTATLFADDSFRSALHQCDDPARVKSLFSRRN